MKELSEVNRKRLEEHLIRRKHHPETAPLKYIQVISPESDSNNVSDRSKPVVRKEINGGKTD